MTNRNGRRSQTPARVLGALLLLVPVFWFGGRHRYLPVEWRTGAVGLVGWALAWACTLLAVWLWVGPGTAADRNDRGSDGLD